MEGSFKAISLVRLKTRIKTVRHFNIYYLSAESPFPGQNYGRHLKSGCKDVHLTPELYWAVIQTTILP